MSAASSPGAISRRARSSTTGTVADSSESEDRVTSAYVMTSGFEPFPHVSATWTSAPRSLRPNLL